MDNGHISFGYAFECSGRFVLDLPPGFDGKLVKLWHGHTATNVCPVDAVRTGYGYMIPSSHGISPRNSPSLSPCMHTDIRPGFPIPKCQQCAAAWVVHGYNR